MFRVGMKVVCVDASIGWGGATSNCRHLRKGALYTVSEITGPIWGLIGPDTFGERAGMQVAEIKMERENDWFLPDRFRPVVERKTDISFAHEILRKVTKKAPAKPKKFETASWWS